MRKTTLTLLLSTILLVSFLSTQALCANTDPIAPGPAPNSGDGIPDGSGFDRDDCPNEGSPSPGPAPNSGDGIPDGSGF